MNKTLICILFSIPKLLFAQITIGEESLPKRNDTLWTLEDNMPNIKLGSEGSDKYWDFSSLSSGAAYKIVLKNFDPTVNTKNLDYDYLIKDVNSVVRYYKKKKNEVFEIAIERPHPMNSDYNCFSQYKIPKLMRYVEMKYKDDKSTNSIIYFNLPGKDIPPIIRKRLPITADSLRVKIEEIQDLRIDAWGSLRLSYNTFDVLRQEQNVFITTSVEVYGAGKWSTINSNILDPNKDLLGDRTERYYIFYAKDSKEPIAKVKINVSERPISAEFKASTSMKLINVESGQRAFILSPNPSFGDVKLEMLNIDYGQYTFEIYNVIGKKIWSDKLLVNRNLESYKFDFSFLGKGTFLWAITNSHGVRLTTKRLVIITP